jgi:hypothetical protein
MKQLIFVRIITKIVMSNTKKKNKTKNGISHGTNTEILIGDHIIQKYFLFHKKTLKTTNCTKNLSFIFNTKSQTPIFILLYIIYYLGYS